MHILHLRRRTDRQFDICPLGFAPHTHLGICGLFAFLFWLGLVASCTHPHTTSHHLPHLPPHLLSHAFACTAHMPAHHTHTSLFLPSSHLSSALFTHCFLLFLLFLFLLPPSQGFSAAYYVFRVSLLYLPLSVPPL